MAVGDGLGDGEAEPRAVGFSARGVGAEEGLGEAARAARAATPGPSSVTSISGFAGEVAGHAHHAAAAILGGVFGEIAQRAGDFAGAAFGHDRAAAPRRAR